MKQIKILVFNNNFQQQYEQTKSDLRAVQVPLPKKMLKGWYLCTVSLGYSKPDLKT